MAIERCKRSAANKMDIEDNNRGFGVELNRSLPINKQPTPNHEARDK